MRILSRISARLAVASLAAFLATSTFVACSGEDGKDGAVGATGAEGPKGKDAKVNVDSIANAIREEVAGTLWDSLYAEPYVDTVYKILFDNAFGTAWMDSTRQALIDSLKEADFDSLYQKLYDSVYADIYSESVIRTLNSSVVYSKDNIYSAYANQYPLMYKDYVYDGKKINVPLTYYVKNTCEKNSKVPCRWKKIMLKAWIEGFTDTATVTDFVNPDTSIYMGPSFKFNTKALAALKTAEPAQYQVEAYALENDHEILLFSKSIPTTIHPMQIKGAELTGIKNPKWWYSVWVTPQADSIKNIVDDIAKKLPNGVLKVYQQYEDDESIAESSQRIAKAVFEVLQARGIKYVQSDGAVSNGQYVRYPNETLRDKQGICIETTFLFASILERLGLKTMIVLVPSHSFIGWYNEETEGSTVSFIETTMIGDKNSTFTGAVKSANDRYNEQVDLGNFTSGDAEIIDIENARKFGIIANDVP